MTLRGDSLAKTRDRIADRFQVSKYKAGRLAHTEATCFNAVSTQACYEDLGVEKIEILETLDKHTCEICAAMDGKVIDKKDYQPGVTVPPFHPNCRGTTCPWFDDMADVGQRIARDNEGEVYYVPPDMTYREWEKTFQEGGEKMSRSMILGASGAESPLSAPKPGNLISSEELTAFINEAEERGYRFTQKVPGLRKSKHGGFENYRGDVSGLYSILDEFDKSKDIWPSSLRRKGILLGYYDFGNADDFAKSVGRNVFFNSRIYDDSKYLADAYAREVKEGHFVKGTNTNAIPWHELGHVLLRDNEHLESRLYRAIKKRGEEFEKTALNLTSIYGINTVGDSYPELLSEILSASTSSDKQKREEALAVLKEVLLL